MKYVTFNHAHTDSTVFSKEDFAKAGVEVDDDLTFHAGRPVKVKNAIADGLANNPQLYGDFTITELTDEEAAQVDADAKAEEAAKAEAEASAAAQADTFPNGGDSGSAQEFSGPSTSTASTGGTKTSGRGSTAGSTI